MPRTCIVNIEHLKVRSMPISDIDECSLHTDDCAQICTNTVGSYVCSCRPGYIHSAPTDTLVKVCYSSSNIGYNMIY